MNYLFYTTRRTLKILCIIGVVLIGLDLIFFYPSDLEIVVGQFLQFGHPQWLTPIVQFISNSIILLGCITALLGLWLLWKREWSFGILLVLSLMSLVSIQPAKAFFHLPRPTIEDLATTWTFSGFSFPSGHAFSATVLVGTLAFVYVRSSPSMNRRVLASIIGASYVLLVGWSRIYLGAHYPSDVLGGYTLGVAMLLILTLIYHHLELYFSSRKMIITEG